MPSKDQILFIGGGMSFGGRVKMENYFKNLDIDVKWGKSWKDWLAWTLEDTFEFIKFEQPVAENADYGIWKIVFEKYFAKFNNKDLIIISHSLGTIFIIKYLVENGFIKKIKQLHLVAPIVSDDFLPENEVEQTGTFTFDISKISDVRKCVEQIHVWHSTDDAMCMYQNAEYIKEQISESKLHTFQDRGHFIQSTFFELFDVLRK